MNKIISCFSESVADANKPLIDILANTNTGFFSGRRASFNNNPLLITESEKQPFSDKVNIAALLRRIYVGMIVNGSPVEDAPTHILVVANGIREDAIDEDSDSIAEMVSEFESKDIPVPQIVFKSADDTDTVTFIESLLGTSINYETISAAIETPVEAAEAVIDTVVEETTDTVEETPVEPVKEVVEAPVVEKPVSKKKK